MKRLLFIYNPHAGKELLKPKLADVIDIFVKAGYEVVAYPTQAYRDAYKKIKKYDSSEYDLIVCSGGDGTLDEVVTGMMKRDRDKREPIGYIPTGTTNDFASSLHIPRGLLEAADNAVNGEVFACDAGRFNDDIFVYIAAFGLFTDVSYQTKQSMKNVLGHLAYVLEGATRIFDIPSYKLKVTHDGETIEDEFILCTVSNSRIIAGIVKLKPEMVEMNDGMFEIILIRYPQNALELTKIVNAITSGEMSCEYIRMFRASELHVRFPDESVSWTLDGEQEKNITEAHITNIHSGIDIMCGRSE